MSTLFVRYNRERAREFQIKTSIIEINNRVSVKKTALNESSTKHISQIHKNYDILSVNLPRINLPRLEFYGEESILMDYIDGKSFGEYLINNLINQDYKLIKEKIKWFQLFVENLSDQKQIFNGEILSDPLKGYYPELNGLQCLPVSNIDLNFDNIIIDENEVAYVIDYEWIIEEPVPINFIIFRALNTFYYGNLSYFMDHLSFSDILNIVNISEVEVQQYIEMSNKFSDFVGTDKEKEVLKNYEKKKIDFYYIDKPNYEAQLFTEKINQKFTEEKSITKKIENNYNEFVFRNLKKGDYRFDPLNKPCLIQMKIIAESKNIKQNINVNFSNSRFNISNEFFLFETEDPQYYFSLPFDVEQLDIFYSFLEVDSNSFLFSIQDHLDIAMSKSANQEESLNIYKSEIALLKNQIEEFTIEKNSVIDNLNETVNSSLNEIGNISQINKELLKDIDRLKRELIENKEIIGQLIDSNPWEFYKIKKTLKKK